MFTILNRWRGTLGIWAKGAAVVIGLIAYFTLGNIWLAISLAAAYILGESFGWGAWIGGIINGYEVAKEKDLNSDEGTKIGIRWLADKISPITGNYQHYCKTALAIRGFYWFGITLLPLVLFGYLSIIVWLGLSIALGLMFPLSIVIGKWTTTKFNFCSKIFCMESAWEHAEVWYGLGQDIVLIILILTL